MSSVQRINLITLPVPAATSRPIASHIAAGFTMPDGVEYTDATAKFYDYTLGASPVQAVVGVVPTPNAGVGTYSLVLNQAQQASFLATITKIVADGGSNFALFDTTGNGFNADVMAIVVPAQNHVIKVPSADLLLAAAFGFATAQVVTADSSRMG